ncbi:E3 ubiquitin-protein ligase [Canna indica]|uniref:RING-type E3 ubiquitin transferase n=1 Tax=Canna indica TaxID=4628 RepID=A0AAQ3Q3T5_9LILI|nr:E3 ubiquitin-protein ligase [Canna indica]
MDDSMGRRTATGIIFTKGGCSITCSEQKYHDKRIRYCSRLGCCASIYSAKDTQVAEQEKASFRSRSSKSLFASDSRDSRGEQRHRRSNEEVDVAESSNRPGDSNKLKCSRRLLDRKDSVTSRRLGKNEKSFSVTLRPLVESEKVHHCSENATGEVGSSGTKLSSRASNEVTRKPRYHYKENSSTPQSSSSRGKSIISSSKGSSSGSSSNNTSLPYHHAPRRSRNQPTNNMNVLSVRTRQSPPGGTRTRPSGQVDASILSRNPVSTSQHSVRESRAVPQSSSRSSRDFRHFYQNRQPGSSSRSVRNRPFYEPVDNGTPTFDSTSEDSNGYAHLNVGSVAEVLLELERIEQDEGLTYEQLSILGNHLFLDGLSFHDQYRDMRMDIDNMTYEELLALGEEMGTVSTALTEEALTKCLTRSNYRPASRISASCGLNEADVKCSICQEEYAVGDELGKLACEHYYHVTCIHQWLRLKNWCPICKASVSPTP